MNYSNIKVNGLDIFYREAGSRRKPDFLLLHGFPSSSAMFRNLIPLLANNFHVIAPDYIGFGQSAAPLHTKFEYTFDNLTRYVEGFLDQLDIDKFYMYVFDYGAPIGFRIATQNPERILGIVSQNGNIYKEGLGPKWSERDKYWKNPTPALRKQYQKAFAPETIKGQYLTGEKLGTVSPDGYSMDIYYTMSPDYAERQSDLIFDYQSNVKLYSEFQKYVRSYHPEIIAAWGKNDPSFIYQGALAFLKDNPDNTEIHLLNGGHFVLESHYQEIANLINAKWGNVSCETRMIK